VTDVSIGALFTGGLLPAAVSGFTLHVVAWFRSRRNELRQVVRQPWAASDALICINRGTDMTQVLRPKAEALGADEREANPRARLGLLTKDHL